MVAAATVTSASHENVVQTYTTAEDDKAQKDHGDQNNR
jgi:hypothetical protein